MNVFTDQLNRKIELSSPAKRIISLVPSQTELLFELGLDAEVVGITKFCIHPKEWFRSKSRVGGTKELDFEKIKKLKPDLIIGNKEENEKAQIELLMKEYPVWMSDIKNLKEALGMIACLGALLGKQEIATNIKLGIEFKFYELEKWRYNYSKLKVTYLIWRDPFMIAAQETFIDDMLNRCGFENVFGISEKRYPVITNEQLQEAKPDLILLSSEPYPFKEKHLAELQLICPNSKVLLVDGEMFSWYGSRLLLAPDYFKGLIQSSM